LIREGTKMDLKEKAIEELLEQIKLGGELFDLQKKNYNKHSPFVKVDLEALAIANLNFSIINAGALYMLLNESKPKPRSNKAWDIFVKMKKEESTNQEGD